MKAHLMRRNDNTSQLMHLRHDIHTPHEKHAPSSRGFFTSSLALICQSRRPLQLRNIGSFDTSRKLTKLSVYCTDNATRISFGFFRV